MTAVLALDASLARTGVALPTGRLLSWSPPRSATGVERLDWFARGIDATLGRYAPDLVVVEGYADHSPGIRSTIALAELGGVLRLVVWRHGVDLAVVAPSQLKKWATGSGRADKDAMMAAAAERGALPANHDEADAALLRLMAIEGRA